ncbi:hypothetical protein FQA47_001013 [Oryzias melastigma]|uniref:Uncharacterized protein n=1 Tax=Oryzias melastigma TaxID=30732 RepID=A0A834KZ15_ORYME|nr:hypothetical protein FQA47_001013 [Oryzias melastigma]
MHPVQDRPPTHPATRRGGSPLHYGAWVSPASESPGHGAGVLSHSGRCQARAAQRPGLTTTPPLPPPLHYPLPTPPLLPLPVTTPSAPPRPTEERMSPTGPMESSPQACPHPCTPTQHNPPTNRTPGTRRPTTFLANKIPTSPADPRWPRQGGTVEEQVDGQNQGEGATTVQPPPSFQPATVDAFPHPGQLGRQSQWQHGKTVTQRGVQRCTRRAGASVAQSQPPTRLRRSVTA